MDRLRGRLRFQRAERRPAARRRPPANSAQQQATITAAVSTGDEITFTTSALTPAGTPNVSVRLFIDGDPNTLEVGLTIEYRTAAQAPLQRKQIDPMFVDAYGNPQPLQAITVEFLDQRTSRWYPYSEAMTIQPIAARITFPAVDGTMPPSTTLAIAIDFRDDPASDNNGTGRMKPRRGFALLAALWFVLAITTVALQFALVAHERRALGLISADRGRQRAAAAGALAMLQAQMDYDLRNNGTASGRSNVAGLQSSDPWLGADSIYSGTYYVDTIPVQVVARDLGTMINVNTATQAQLNTLFSFVLGDASAANQMSSAILDWRDQDDLPRSGGAEKDDYIKANMLTLPTNAPFREVEDLINVYGVTWDELNALYPYLTTHGPSGNGASRVNINSAPEPVLRSLPGMTDAILVQILALRSQGRRIQSMAQVMAGTPQGRQAAP